MVLDVILSVNFYSSDHRPNISSQHNFAIYFQNDNLKQDIETFSLES